MTTQTQGQQKKGQGASGVLWAKGLRYPLALGPRSIRGGSAPASGLSFSSEQECQGRGRARGGLSWASEALPRVTGTCGSREISSFPASLTLSPCVLLNQDLLSLTMELCPQANKLLWSWPAEGLLDTT